MSTSSTGLLLLNQRIVEMEERRVCGDDGEGVDVVEDRINNVGSVLYKDFF
jgi:hypothetical protein